MILDDCGLGEVVRSSDGNQAPIPVIRVETKNDVFVDVVVFAFRDKMFRQFFFVGSVEVEVSFKVTSNLFFKVRFYRIYRICMYIETNKSNFKNGFSIDYSFLN